MTQVKLHPIVVSRLGVALKAFYRQRRLLGKEPQPDFSQVGIHNGNGISGLQRGKLQQMLFLFAAGCPTQQKKKRQQQGWQDA